LVESANPSRGHRWRPTAVADSRLVSDFLNLTAFKTNSPSQEFSVGLVEDRRVHRGLRRNSTRNPCIRLLLSGTLRVSGCCQANFPLRQFPERRGKTLFTKCLPSLDMVQ